MEETWEGNGLFLEKEAKFAGGTVGTEVVGEMEGGSGACGYRGGVRRKTGTKSTEGKEAGGFVEAQTSSQLSGCSPDDPATECRIEGTETVELDRNSGLAGYRADGAAAASDRSTGKKKLGKETI